MWSLSGCRYYKAAKLADALVRDEHYTVDEKQKSVLMTEDGYEAAEDVLEVALPYNMLYPVKTGLFRAIDSPRGNIYGFRDPANYASPGYREA